jgi:hypothetical protein
MAVLSRNVSLWIRTTSCELASRSWQGVLDTTLCDKDCQWLATDIKPGSSEDLGKIVIDMTSVPLEVLGSDIKPGSSEDLGKIVIDDTTLCDKDCQWLATCQWFSPGTSVSYTNKTDRHDIAEILLKVTLNTTSDLSIFFHREISVFQSLSYCCVILSVQCDRSSH